MKNEYIRASAPLDVKEYELCSIKWYPKNGHGYEAKNTTGTHLMDTKKNQFFSVIDGSL